MKRLLTILFFLFCAPLYADTVPSTTVKAKLYSGDGNTAATLTGGGSLNVNVTNQAGTTTVNQGTAGSSPWLFALPTGACSETGHLSSIDTKLTSPLAVTGSFYQTTQPVSGALTCNAGSGTFAVSLASLPALSAGTATIGNVGIIGTVPVSGTFWQTTQPVSVASLPLATNAATASNQTSGNTTLTAISGQLPATLGAKTSANSLSMAPASDSSFPVTGTFWQATQPVSGSLGRSWNLSSGSDSVAATQSGTWSMGLPSGASTSALQTALNAQFPTTLGQTTKAASLSVAVASDQSLPVTGTFYQATQPVSGTFWQTTQPVSVATLPALTTGAATIGAVNVNGTVPVSGTFWQATQPVSLASAPLAPGAATSANQSTEITSLGTIATNSGTQATAANQSTGNTSLATIATNTTGVATAANQSTGNTSLGTIATNTTGLATASAQTTGNTSLGTIATNSGTQATAANQTTGNTSLSTIATNTTGLSTSANQTTELGYLNTIAANVPTKGLQSVANSQPVVGPNATTLTTAAYTSSTGILNLDMLTNTGSGWYDAAGYSSFFADIYTTTTVTGGVITFEQTNDTTNDAAGVVMNLQDSTVITQTNVTSLTLAASTIKHYQAPITSRYIRFRISTAFAGTGTLGATLQLKQTPYTPIALGVTQATAASLNVNVGTLPTLGTVSSITSDNLAIPGIIADVASAAITTTTTTATLTPTNGVGYLVQIPVTAATGTTPTMIVGIQESADTGTNWTTVYTFPTITTTGFYVSPPLFFKGNRVRYVQTIAGTTPSFTRAINRLQMSAVAAAPVNNNATFASAAVSVATTLTAPANAIGFILQNLNSNTTNLRYAIGATASATNGMQLEPGRDTGEIHAGQNISVCPESGTITYSIQWVQQ